ncbi:Protein N-acetyltransferase, RimJ/RimL family [Lachnospiraceae bacterium]|nr:Protein N-acetyltransferase, RimJ/RimL family [Lachnospiraceae bacterium]
MILRAYKKEDAAIICSWIKSEDELYKWSADIFNKYPLFEDDINDNYSSQTAGGRFFPMTAVSDEGKVIGHFIIRYPRKDDNSTVRFGFVIVDPEYRGKGNGSVMLRTGIRYVTDNMDAERVELGVFENNEAARHCYEAVGFKEYDHRTCELPIGIWNCIDMQITPKT